MWLFAVGELLVAFFFSPLTEKRAYYRDIWVRQQFYKLNNSKNGKSSQSDLG